MSDSLDSIVISAAAKLDAAGHGAIPWTVIADLVVRLFDRCDKTQPDQVAAMASKPTRMEGRALRHHARKSLRDNGIRPSAAAVEAICASLSDAAVGTSAADLVAACDECRGLLGEG